MPDYKTYPLGIDVSAWQQAIDWAKVASMAKFAFIKAGQNLAPDFRYVTNWTNSKDKLPRGPYWFYDWRSTGAKTEAQGKVFKATAIPPGEVSYIMDFEKPYADWSPEPFPSRTVALDIIRRFKDTLEIDKALLYMNSSTLKTLLPFPSWLTDEFDLYLAAYPTIEDPPKSNKWRMVRNAGEIPYNWIPASYGWPWKFWQFTPKLDGRLYGVWSLDLDGDLFNGTDEELRKYCGFGKISDAEKLRRLWEAHPELHDV